MTPRPLDTSPYVPPGERIILARGPSPLFIILRSLWTFASLAATPFAISFISGKLELGLTNSEVFTPPIAAALALLVWNFLVWINRDYVLTEVRVLRASGVFRRVITEVPLRNLQHVETTKLLRERLTGLGTLGFNSSGTAWTELAWVMIPRPRESLETVRREIDRVQAGAPAMTTRDHTTRIPVIGLAGGIGSGKSAVARAMEALGAVVIDSDAQARAALDLPRVREELLKWWGRSILDADGKVSRKALADIVFKNDSERQRLEALIHPIVKMRRAELIAQAERSGATAVVVDAPLLFEAGVDAECDAVIFVDAPLDQRLDRVRRTRAWDDHELHRREKAQLPLEEKRRRSTHTITNATTESDLAQQVQSVFSLIRAQHHAN